jgi:radical SAM family uncharacterized protein/radical SAM-linked protein
MLESILAGIDKPGRYFGNEFNAYCKDFDQARVRFALAFPDVYEVGLSHLGLQILYHGLNRMEGVLADRVYAPWMDFEARLRECGEPLRALESQRPLNEFDFVGFSLQYELSYTNLLTMLDLARIPLRARERGAGHPWIIGGGPCAFNPEPLAEVFDFVVLGEAEEVLEEIVEVFHEWRAGGGTRQEFLERLRRIAGIYVPAFFAVAYDPQGKVTGVEPRYADYPCVEKRLLMDLDRRSPIPENPLVPLLGIVHDRLSVEIARGCTRGCRFCQAGFIYRPVRERHPQQVLERAGQALASSGFDELSLLSLSSGDYCQVHGLLAALMEQFAAQKVAVSFPSLRVGTLTPDLMELIKRVRKTGFTLAPEAGSERLRRVINKNIREADLLATSQMAFQLGWQVLKLYFMMGLPTETRADLDELVELCLKVWRLAGQRARKATVNVSVSTFVPKPQTPFQRVGQIPVAAMQENLETLRNRLNRRGLRLKWHDPAQSLLEAVFARGDRRLLATLERAWQLGARFDGWTEQFQFHVWQRAFQETGLDPEFYATRERSADEVLPWDHLSSKVSREFFTREYQRACTEAYTPDCRWHACSQCGVCDHEEIQPQLHGDASEVSSSSGTALVSSLHDNSFLYRLRYAKKGNIRFFGQLEMGRCFARAIRRAGLPVAYSEGFHPHPKLSLGDALPLGMESDVEEAYVTLTERVDPQGVSQALNRSLPQGLAITEVAQVGKRLPQPTWQRVTYHVDQLQPSVAHGLLRNWRERLDERLVKKTKRHCVEVALRQVLLDIRRVDEQALEMDLREGTGLRLRPAAILIHVVGNSRERAATFRICKTAVQPYEDDKDVR